MTHKPSIHHRSKQKNKTTDDRVYEEAIRRILKLDMGDTESSGSDEDTKPMTLTTALGLNTKLMTYQIVHESAHGLDNHWELYGGSKRCNCFPYNSWYAPSHWSKLRGRTPPGPLDLQFDPAMIYYMTLTMYVDPDKYREMDVAFIEAYDDYMYGIRQKDEELNFDRAKLDRIYHVGGGKRSDNLSIRNTRSCILHLAAEVYPGFRALAYKEPSKKQGYFILKEPRMDYTNSERVQRRIDKELERELRRAEEDHAVTQAIGKPLSKKRAWPYGTMEPSQTRTVKKVQDLEA